MRFKMFSIGVLAVATVSVWMAPLAHAQVPSQMSYQGVLLFNDGTIVPDDAYRVRFEIFDAAAAGNSLFSQELTVSVLNGLFSVILSGPNLVTALANPPRYLEVIIVSGGSLPDPVTLAPRQLLTSVPYALMSGTTGVPAGAIILWDQTGVCPEGFEEAQEYQNLAIRGADSGGANDDIPDLPGETCPVGAGCGAAAAAYDDTLDELEMPAHIHEIIDPGSEGNGETRIASVANRKDSSSYGGITEPTGGNGPHYHPFRTLLFCRKI